jgi:hypothetical protein
VPQSIEIRVIDIPDQLKGELHKDILPGVSHQVSDLNDLCASIVFVNFYEIHKPFMKQHWGKVKDWPGVVNFARVIRNCLAHSGRISIDAGTPGGSWRKFSYAPADDGRRILGTELFAPDLIYLLLDLSAALEAAGAPNLATPPIAKKIS